MRQTTTTTTTPGPKRKNEHNKRKISTRIHVNLNKNANETSSTTTTPSISTFYTFSHDAPYSHHTSSSSSSSSSSSGGAGDYGCHATSNCTANELLEYLEDHTEEVVEVILEGPASSEQQQRQQEQSRNYSNGTAPFVWTDDHVQRFCQIVTDPASCHIERLKFIRQGDLTQDATSYLATWLETNATVQDLELSHVASSVGMMEEGMKELIQAIAYSWAGSSSSGGVSGAGSSGVDEDPPSGSSRRRRKARTRPTQQKQMQPPSVSTISQPHDKPRPPLQRLTLQGNHLNHKIGTSLAALLRHSTTLTALDLAHNDLGTKGIKVVAPAVARSRTLQRLSLAYNHLQHKGVSLLVKEFLKVPSSASSLTSLDLTANKLGYKGFESICDWLLFKGPSINKTLQELSLGSNHLNSYCCPLLGTLLSQHYTLRVLRLGANELGRDDDSGLQYIAHGLARNTGLQVLEMDWNQWSDMRHDNSDDGADEQQPGCTSSSDDENTVSPTHALAHALTKNGTLHTLNLSGNRLSDMTAILLAKALPHTLHLQHLDLSNNAISCRGAKALASAILVMPDHFHTLMLHDNPEIPVDNTSSDMMDGQGQDADALPLTNVCLRRAFQYKRNQRQWLRRLVHQMERNPQSIKSINWLSKIVSDYEVDKLASTLMAIHRDVITNEKSKKPPPITASPQPNSKRRQPCRLNTIYLSGKGIERMDKLSEWMMGDGVGGRNEKKDGTGEHGNTVQTNGRATAPTSCPLQRFYLRDSSVGKYPLSLDRLYQGLLGGGGCHHSTLLVLSLTGSCLGDDGALRLARHLISSSSTTKTTTTTTVLQRLSLGNNRIGNIGFVALANAIPKSLRSLNLCHNRITGAAATIIPPLLPNSNTTTTETFQHKQEEQQQQPWDALIRNGTSLRELYLDQNPLTDHALLEFGLALATTNNCAFPLQTISLRQEDTSCDGNAPQQQHQDQQQQYQQPTASPTTSGFTQKGLVALDKFLPPTARILH